MAVNKTKATGASVADYIASRANEEQAADCAELIKLLKRVTKQPAKMWGPSIVGFGRYEYTYDSGHSGEAPVAGFAIRGRELVVYIDVGTTAQQRLLAKLGKHKMGKVCLYIKRLADIDRGVLEQLVAGSVARVGKRPGA